MKPSLPAVGLAALVFVSGRSGGTDHQATATHGTKAGAGAAPAPVRTPTSPGRLPDPLQSPLPVGSKTLYAGPGRGEGGVTLPSSAGKASSITVIWTCAGPSKFDIIAAGRLLAGSQCGDGTGVFTAEIPHSHLHDLAWKFSAAGSVVWRIVVAQPPKQ